MKIPLTDSWKPYAREAGSDVLRKFIAEAYNGKRKIFPPHPLIFSALNLCPFDQVRVVILGQDPYHDDGQAHGLAFSVPERVTAPPSLGNIFKEIENDLGRPAKIVGGDLTPWAKQGVLLLNAVLTVEAHKAGSHRGRGWEEFTSHLIKVLSREKENLVFLLWGNDARLKRNLIDVSKHLILEAPHPSPLSAHRGFFGSHQFSKSNEYLRKHGIKEIDW